MYSAHSFNSDRHDTARAVRTRRRALALNIASTCAVSIVVGLLLGWMLARLAGVIDGGP